MRLGLAGLLVLGASAVAYAATAPTTTTTTARTTSSSAGTTTTTARTTSSTAATTTTTARTTTGTTTTAAAGTSTSAPMAVARTGGSSTIKVVFPVAATPATDSEKAMARESAYRLAHWATYGFRFYYVHRGDNEFTNLYVDSVTDELYWHADFLSEDNRYRYTYGSAAMYLTGVSSVGNQAARPATTAPAAGTTTTTTTTAPAPAATTATGDPGDPINGVTVSDVTEENIGGVNMAVATVDPANFNYTAWQDYYVDTAGAVLTPAQVQTARTTATTEGKNAPLYYYMRNAWHMNYARRMECQAQTVQVTAELGRDSVHHLIAKAILEYYKSKVDAHEVLNFVAQAYVSGISGYTVTDNGADKPKTVSASVTLLLPKTIYMEQGGLYEQWRYNFFNIRDYSGIERGANDYYGQSYYDRSGTYRSGGDLQRRRAAPGGTR
jgi:hypothetical protein